MTSIAHVRSDTDTEIWIKSLAGTADLIPQGTPLRLLTRSVSFAHPEDRDELLKCLGDDDDTRKREKGNNYLLSDWEKAVRQTGMLALMCSTDNLTSKRTADVRSIQE
ncbi:hypothetical protein H2201_000849 [Coniosporium apollinis]|uniref:PH domain-containing protein n=1 Tax=Coniosporium apollinis TaxID=61459 RepID=A0ABQ9P818_9PEZI|nr:hypothetical protein H2201_000849 [Coniosporium apollinis]